MLPDPDSKAKDQPGARAPMSWRNNNDNDDDQGRSLFASAKGNQEVWYPRYVVLEPGTSGIRYPRLYLEYQLDREVEFQLWF